jgi:flagellar biosynthesis protein FlhA
MAARARMLAALPTGDLALAIGVLALVLVLVVPLPTWIIDLGLAASFASSLLVLMVALFLTRPLDFTSFPTILLLTTLLRLALNVATTRVILTDGHEGPTAAGHVVYAFGGYLMGGDVVVGIIVFAILVVVLLFAAGVVAYSAWAWRQALAEPVDEGPDESDTAGAPGAAGPA